MFLLSAYFLAAHSYKRMRLTTSVYGIITQNPTAIANKQVHAANNKQYLQQPLHHLTYLIQVTLPNQYLQNYVIKLI